MFVSNVINTVSGCFSVKYFLFNIHTLILPVHINKQNMIFKYVLKILTITHKFEDPNFTINQLTCSGTKTNIYISMYKYYM